jgi:hypothetical protein
MSAVLASADRVLRDLGDARAPERRARTLIAAILLAGPVYGAFMGSFALSAERAPLVLYAAAKVPLLILVTTLVCLPGFFVLNTVLGLRADFARAMRAILAGQAALTLALASLGPITRFIYASGATHRGALLFNAAMFTVATAAAQTIMLRRYRPLTADPATGGRHRVMLWTWVVLYAFVGVQMAWMLRPFVGSPGIPVAFFREEPFSNAYVVIVRLVLGR